MVSRSPRLIRALAALAFMGTVLAACNAQQPRSNQAQAKAVPTAAAAVCAPVTSNAPADLQKKSGYQQVAISVTDEKGREVQNLSKNDFVVKIGDDPVAVQFAEYQPNSPASVLILADTSGSTEPKLPQTREAITQLVNNLDPRDDVSLWAFSGKPFNLQSFTNDHSAVIERETILHSYGLTSLYDSVRTSTAMLQKHGCYARRILVVISDGIDNTSGVKPTEATDDIRKCGVSAYAIAIGNTQVPEPGLRFGPFTMTGDEDSVDEKSLGKLITNSAQGSTFRVADSGDSDLLAVAAKSILQSSRGQYVVGFIDASKNDSAAVTIQVKDHKDYLVFKQKTRLTDTSAHASMGVRQAIAEERGGFRSLVATASDETPCSLNALLTMAIEEAAITAPASMSDEVVVSCRRH